MKYPLSVLVLVFSGLDLIGVIDLPVLVSIGLFVIALLIMVDTITGFSDRDDSKGES